MAGKVTIGCKLPSGITLRNPLADGETVTLNGKNKTLILGSDYGITEVDADFWAAWKAAHGDKKHTYPAFKSGAIFEAKNAAEAAEKGKERFKERTGFEKLSPASMGVKPADGKDPE